MSVDWIALQDIYGSMSYGGVTFGVQNAFGIRPNLVTGPAAQTSAAVELVRKLTGLPAINVIDPEQKTQFREFLLQTLGIESALPTAANH